MEHDGTLGCEWVILAERAEVINNKLYLMGGGWDVLAVSQGFPFVHHAALAIAFRIPWHETNQRHALAVEVVGEDGGAALATVGGQIEVGRPAGIRPGQTQRLQMGLNIPLELPKPGGYEVVVRLGDRRVGGTQFHVIATEPRARLGG